MASPSLSSTNSPSSSSSVEDDPIDLIKELEPEKKELDVEYLFHNPSKLKKQGRLGYPMQQRKVIWKRLILEQEKRSAEDYELLCEDIFYGAGKPTSFPHVPDFGSPMGWDPRSIHLTPHRIRAAKSILCVLGCTHADMSHCPILPDLICLLLIFFDESTTFRLANALIYRSKKDSFFFTTNQKNFFRWTKTFSDLLKEEVPKTFEVIDNLKLDPSRLFQVWITRCFVQYLPFRTIFRILDAYFLEGYKIFFRVGLGILKLHKKELKKSPTAIEFLSNLHRLCTNSVADPILEMGFDLSLSRSHIGELCAAHVDISSPLGSATNLAFHIPRMYAYQNTAQQQYLLNPEAAYSLWSWLPSHLRIQDPLLLYSSDTDGYSLSTLLTKANEDGGERGVFVLIQDASRRVIGFFINEQLPTHYTRKLVPTLIHPSSFLFTIAPAPPVVYKHAIAIDDQIRQDKERDLYHFGGRKAHEISRPHHLYGATLLDRAPSLPDEDNKLSSGTFLPDGGDDIILCCFDEPCDMVIFQGYKCEKPASIHRPNRTHHHHSGTAVSNAVVQYNTPAKHNFNSSSANVASSSQTYHPNLSSSNAPHHSHSHHSHSNHLHHQHHNHHHGSHTHPVNHHGHNDSHTHTHTHTHSHGHSSHHPTQHDKEFVQQGVSSSTDYANTVYVGHFQEPGKNAALDQLFDLAKQPEHKVDGLLHETRDSVSFNVPTRKRSITVLDGPLQLRENSTSDKTPVHSLPRGEGYLNSSEEVAVGSPSANSTLSITLTSDTGAVKPLQVAQTENNHPRDRAHSSDTTQTTTPAAAATTTAGANSANLSLKPNVHPSLVHYTSSPAASSSSSSTDTDSEDVIHKLASASITDEVYLIFNEEGFGIIEPGHGVVYFLSADMKEGISRRSRVFNSPPLSTPLQVDGSLNIPLTSVAARKPTLGGMALNQVDNGRYDILKVELWGFQPPSTMSPASPRTPLEI